MKFSRTGRSFGPSDFFAEVTMLVLTILGFVLVGFPLVYVMWEALNHALSLHFAAIAWIEVVPATLLFGLLLWFLATRVRRLTEG